MQTLIGLSAGIFIGIALYNLGHNIGYNNGIKYCTERVKTLVDEHRKKK